MSIRDSFAALQSRREAHQIDGIGEVFLHQMSLKDLIKFQENLDAGSLEMTTKAIMNCVRDHEGKNVFSEADSEIIHGLPASLASELFSKIMRLNAISPDDAKKN